MNCPVDKNGLVDCDRCPHSDCIATSIEIERQNAAINRYRKAHNLCIDCGRMLKAGEIKICSFCERDRYVKERKRVLDSIKQNYWRGRSESGKSIKTKIKTEDYTQNRVRLSNII